MGLFGAAHGWRGGGGEKFSPPYNHLQISYNYETCHTYTLSKEDPQNT